MCSELWTHTSKSSLIDKKVKCRVIPSLSQSISQPIIRGTLQTEKNSLKSTSDRVTEMSKRLLKTFTPWSLRGQPKSVSFWNCFMALCYKSWLVSIVTHIILLHVFSANVLRFLCFEQKSFENSHEIRPLFFIFLFKQTCVIKQRSVFVILSFLSWDPMWV